MDCEEGTTETENIWRKRRRIRWEINTSGKHVSSSGWRMRREEEGLNNPASRSRTAINVAPGGEQFPFWCKTKPGWMRSSDSRKMAALRAKLLWGRHLGRKRESEREKVRSKHRGLKKRIFRCWHFVQFGVSTCFLTVRRGHSCGQERKEDKLGRSCSLAIFWESPW